MNQYIPPSHEEIALCAYFIYLHEGCPQGQDLSHWLQAEIQLVAARMLDAGLAAN